MKKLAVLYLLALLLLAVPLAIADEGSNEGKTEKKVKAQPVDTLVTMRHEIRNSANPIVTLETEYGKMVVELYHDVAPAHADSFLARTNDGFYSGMKFHRIVKNFMIQCGNPFLVGKQSVGYYLPDERSGLPHKFGTLSMASRGHPTTAQSQFFIVLTRAQHLDKGYVVFGQVLKGFDVLHTLGQLEVKKNKAMRGEKSVPVKDVFLTKAYQSDAEGNPLK